jgi:hypothetical protein
MPSEDCLVIRDMREVSLSRVEAGSNTSTVTLLVVGGDEKEVSNLRE